VREGGRVRAQLALVDGCHLVRVQVSIGSSMVMMWMAFSRLILLMMAASVVDLPEPVGR